MRQQAALFASRLAKRARHLRRWPTRQGITCYRLYERDVPEVPLLVDRYDQRLHMAEFERPHDHSPAEHADWLDLMIRTAGETLEVPREWIYLKQRRRQRGSEQYTAGSAADEEPVQFNHLASPEATFVVEEAGLKFEVNLADYLDTGLFLDHRITRGMVRDAAEGKRFLNLFAYTGAFSVYAAAGGAIATTTVDWSNTYLDWAGRNFALNAMTSPVHPRLRADCMAFVRELPREPLFDLAVVDPPTFSNRKGVEGVFDVQRDYAELLSELSHRLAPSGVVYFSTNFRRFKFDAAALPAYTAREISRQTVPEDFRNRRIHRCWRLVKAE